MPSKTRASGFYSVLLNYNFKLLVCSFGFCKSFFNCVCCCENHTYAAMTCNLRLSEKADLHSRFLEHLLKITELIFTGISLYNYSLGSGRTVELHLRYRKSEHSACMKGKLGHILRYHRNHTRIVRSWRDFTEDHIPALDEELDAEDTIATKGP